MKISGRHNYKTSTTAFIRQAQKHDNHYEALRLASTALVEAASLKQTRQQIKLLRLIALSHQKLGKLELSIANLKLAQILARSARLNSTSRSIERRLEKLSHEARFTTEFIPVRTYQ